MVVITKHFMWNITFALHQHTNENNQSKSVQVSTCQQKVWECENAAAIQTCVGIYVNIVKYQHEFPGLITAIS